MWKVETVLWRNIAEEAEYMVSHNFAPTPRGLIRRTLKFLLYYCPCPFLSFSLFLFWVVRGHTLCCSLYICLSSYLMKHNVCGVLIIIIDPSLLNIHSRYRIRMQLFIVVMHRSVFAKDKDVSVSHEVLQSTCACIALE